MDRMDRLDGIGSSIDDRPSKHRWQPDLLDGGSMENMGGSSNSIKRNSRTKKGLGRPLLVDQPLPAPDFPKDVKVGIRLDVKVLRNFVRFLNASKPCDTR